MQAKFHHMGFDLRFDDSDVVNPTEYSAGLNYDGSHDGRTRPFLLHDAGFTVAVVFAASLGEALDQAVDAGKLDRFAVKPEDLADYGDDEEERAECLSYLGNAGEPFDIETLQYVELPVVPFSFAALFLANEAAA